jgi:3-carboxy-cis,cis-muconate cycloisomerase
MADLFWPGDERAGDLVGPQAFLAAMVRVEEAWLAALAGAGVAPTAAAVPLGELVGPEDVEAVAEGAETGGTPALPLLRLLRSRLAGEPAAWLHRGLTSQDVVDSALMLCARAALDRLAAELDAQVGSLVALADAHRGTVMAGRTLTQHAVPVTFGLKAASWLVPVLDARLLLRGLATPAQLGGAAGTMAGTVELARQAGAPDPVGTAVRVVTTATAELGLGKSVPWHTGRTPVTRIGDALVTATDAWGRIARDVLSLARPEVGELSEPAGRGGSSTMPHKTNPVLSVLVRRAALAAPALAAALHTAAAEAVDERPDGAWHVEWSALAQLARRTVVAASQTTELLDGLVVHADRMRATAEAAADDLLAEQRSLGGEPTGPAGYLGATAQIIDAVLERARQEARP